MTIGGAIAELQNLIDADDVPFYYKGGINKVIETIQMEVNEQNRLLKEIAHRLDLHERAMAKAMRDTADTPQTDWHYDEQDATWYPYKHEDEPQQKSCATCKHALGNWDGESNNCGRCCGADRRFYEPKTESQTERSE